MCEIENKLNSLSSCIDVKRTYPKMAKDIWTVFVNTARETFGMSKHSKNFVNDKFNKPWFNRVRKTARRKLPLAKRLYNRNDSTNNKKKLKALGKQFNRTMDYCTKDYKNDTT